MYTQRLHFVSEEWSEGTADIATAFQEKRNLHDHKLLHENNTVSSLPTPAGNCGKDPGIAFKNPFLNRVGVSIKWHASTYKL